MSIKAYRPITPAQRQKTTEDYDQITTNKPLKSLLKAKKQNAGKNNQGRITVRHRGGGVKRHYRILTHNLPKNLTLTVEEIEYDPNRSARIARVKDQNGVVSHLLYLPCLNNPITDCFARLSWFHLRKFSKGNCLDFALDIYTIE